MASLSNDLEGLSLDLPDVVVDTTKAVASSKNRRHRRDRLKKKNLLQVLEKKDIPEADPDEDEAAEANELMGACALPLDHCRVPEISFPPVVEDEEAARGDGDAGGQHALGIERREEREQRTRQSEKPQFCILYTTTRAIYRTRHFRYQCKNAGCEECCERANHTRERSH